MATGGCHCGAIRYEISGEPINSLLCHCSDCQRASGAPMVGWIMVRDDQLRVTGEPSIYASSESARRYFCIQCGTSLFYSNTDIMPDRVDIQLATLDEPGEFPPQGHVQVADRIDWMKDAHGLPHHERWANGD